LLRAVDEEVLPPPKATLLAAFRPTVQVAIYGYMATIAKMPNGIIKYKKT